jgi:hypothetical protein
VLYDPRHPQQARLRGEGRVMIPLVTAGFTAAALLLAVVLVKTRTVGVTPPARMSTTRPLSPPELTAEG